MLRITAVVLLLLLGLVFVYRAEVTLFVAGHAMEWARDVGPHREVEWQRGPEVAEAADFTGSTAAMIRYVAEAPPGPILLLTECAMGDNVAATNPDKELLRLCSVRCPHMNAITLEHTLEALRQMRYEIDVAPSVRDRARRSLERMIAIG